MTTEFHDNGTMADEENEDEFGNIADMIHLFGFTISMPFLLITFIVYTILPEFKNIHGLTLRGYVGSLLGTCSTLLTFIIIITQDVTPPCLLVGCMLFFSTIASYCWLNVMSFDIWWTFGGFGPLRISKPQSERKKFIIYSIYVWGSTTLLTTSWAIVDSLSEEVFQDLYSCLLAGNVWYVYGPIGITLSCNMILFVLTITKMIHQNDDTAKHLDTKDSSRQGVHKQWFALYLKLYIVMGTRFSLQIVTWLSLDSKYIEFVKDIFTSYQGIIIFIMFICKKRILRLLIKRCRCQRAKSLELNSRRSTASAELHSEHVKDFSIS